MVEPMSGQIVEQVPKVEDFADALSCHLRAINPNKVFFVVGHHITEQEIVQWASGFQYTRFTGFSPNPKMEEVDVGVEVFRDNNCDILVAVGGGSAIDVAKAIKWKLVCDTEDGVNTENEIPKLIAAPTTAGTGSESTPFAVVYVDGVKNSLDEYFLLPDVALLCGELTLSVPVYHRKAAFMDALCQAVESMWAATATSDSRSIAVEALGELLTHGYQYIQSMSSGVMPGNDPSLKLTDQLAAAQGTLKGANLAGCAIAATRTTAPHAMSYGLTSEFGLAHGHAVALCWVPVCEAHVTHAYETPDFPQLRDALETVSNIFDLDGPHDLPMVFAGILQELGLDCPSISEDQAMMLASRVNAQRLSNNPVSFTAREITELYLRSTTVGSGSVRLPQAYEGKYGRVFEYEVNLDSIGKWALTHKKHWAKAEQIQEIAIEMLIDIDVVCRKLGIEYFLFEGALLGAIRHKGPIPWDDDIDVAFLREDYDRFVQEAPKFLGNEYVIDTYETNPKHWTISGKVIKKARTDYMHLRAEGLALANGVFVDLFALDNVLQERSRWEIMRGRYVAMLRSLLFHRSGYQMVPAKKLGFIKKTLSRFTPVLWLHRRIDKSIRKHSDQKTGYVANFGSMYKVELETFETTDLVPTKSSLYGGTQVRVPANPEKILKKVYGEYLDFPPYHERSGKHSFIERKEYFEHLTLLQSKQPWYW